MSLGNNWRIKIRCERIRSYSGIFYKTTKRLVACIQMHLASFWPRQPLHREGEKNRLFSFQSVEGERYFERKVLLKMVSKLMPDPSGRRRHILKLFLKSLRDKMISKSDKSEEVKILENTCVFTVRLHLRNVDNARRKLARTLFFWICH